MKTVVGTSRAMRMAQVLKMFLLYYVVEAVYCLMKKVIQKFVSSMMTPAWEGKISLSMLVKRNIQKFKKEKEVLLISNSFSFVECISDFHMESQSSLVGDSK